MDNEKYEIRVLLRFFWKKRLKARAAAKEICDVEGQGTVSVRTAQRWFKRFEEGRTDLGDSARSGRPLEVDSDALRAAVEVNPGTSTRRLSDDLGVSQSTAVRHLHRIGKVNRSCRVVPHELSAAQAQRRVEACIQLRANPNDERFLNAELYSQQLERMYAALGERYPALVNRKRVLLQQDNARPHTAHITQEKIEELEGIELMPHPAYSPDLAPSDYHLFRSMAHFLRGRRFDNDQQVEEACREFFASKEPAWYRRGVEQLAERWERTIAHDGLYWED
jgi:histone-lysine N-methyltransferase SETMAR